MLLFIKQFFFNIPPLSGDQTMQGTEEFLCLLRKIDPKKPYGTKLFNALARLTVSVGVEAVCVRTQGTETQVYMTRRSANDTAYPGQWHCPGSIIRPGEEISYVFSRLGEKEFGSKLSSWRFVANINNIQEKRGHFLSLVYLCQMAEDKQKGKWFSKNFLPENTVAFHSQRIIPAALKAFLSNQ